MTGGIKIPVGTPVKSPSDLQQLSENIFYINKDVLYLYYNQLIINYYDRRNGFYYRKSL